MSSVEAAPKVPCSAEKSGRSVRASKLSCEPCQWNKDDEQRQEERTPKLDMVLQEGESRATGWKMRQSKGGDIKGAALSKRDARDLHDQKHDVMVESSPAIEGNVC